MDSNLSILFALPNGLANVEAPGTGELEPIARSSSSSATAPSPPAELLFGIPNAVLDPKGIEPKDGAGAELANPELEGALAKLEEEYWKPGVDIVLPVTTFEDLPKDTAGVGAPDEGPPKGLGMLLACCCCCCGDVPPNGVPKEEVPNPELCCGSDED